MLALKCLVLAQDKQANERLVSLLKRQETKLYLASQTDELPGLIASRSYDVFLWITPDPTPEQAKVKTFLNEIPYLFSCLLTRHTGKESPFDFVHTYGTPNDERALEAFVGRLLKLGKRLKTGQEIASLILHDLRTPMQNMSSYVDMLIDGTFGELNEGQLKILRLVNAQATVAEELIQQLTQYLRLHKKEFSIEPRPTDLNALITETLRSVWIWADRKDIKLLSHIDSQLPRSLLDPLAIRRVLFNLLLNAIKFSPKNSTIQLTVKQEKGKNRTSQVHFAIRDQGPGIPTEYLDNVFEAFFRVKYPQAQIKGQGLGLYIAKLFIEAHGGRIGVYNNREGGATFHFTLPLKAAGQ